MLIKGRFCFMGLSQKDTEDSVTETMMTGEPKELEGVCPVIRETGAGMWGLKSL